MCPSNNHCSRPWTISFLCTSGHMHIFKQGNSRIEEEPFSAVNYACVKHFCAYMAGGINEVNHHLIKPELEAMHSNPRSTRGHWDMPSQCSLTRQFCVVFHDSQTLAFYDHRQLAFSLAWNSSRWRVSDNTGNVSNGKLTLYIYIFVCCLASASQADVCTNTLLLCH